MITRQAPSNIALVKYWGKHGRQLPRNPNASLTLSVARTITRLEWGERLASDSSPVQLRLFFDGAEHPAFAKRVRDHLAAVSGEHQLVKRYALTVHTRNTFPHGAGIASSASAMAALAECVVGFEEAAGGMAFADDAERQRRVSRLARLGSGSAARSVFATAAAWGDSPALPGSSDDYAVPLGERLASVFHDYRDSIVLVSRTEKSVSSTAGHALMDEHPYAAERYRVAARRFERLLAILRRGELDDFCALVEADALDLHALMMQSTPPYLLLAPATLAVVEATRRFRRESGIPICFTLDAGPNVHLLYPSAHQSAVGEWLLGEVAGLLPGGKLEGRIIHDHVGEGPGAAAL